jgi:hypothetical protein
MPTNWLMSEKLDGMRWSGQQILCKTGNLKLNPPLWFVVGLPRRHWMESFGEACFHVALLSMHAVTGAAFYIVPESTHEYPSLPRRRVP